MKGEPFWRRSRDETIACGRPPPARGGGPPLPLLPRPQGEDPLAPDLAPAAARPAPQLRAGRPAGRAVRRLRPRRPPAVEHLRPRGPGRPPPPQPQPGKTDRRPAGRVVRGAPAGAARRRPVVVAQGRGLRPRPLGRRGLPADRLALAEEARLPAGRAPAPPPQGGHGPTAAEVALTAWSPSSPSCGGRSRGGRWSCGARTRPGWGSSRWPAGSGH